jgi:hypothetical protein
LTALFAEVRNLTPAAVERQSMACGFAMIHARCHQPPYPYDCPSARWQGDRRQSPPAPR